MFKQLTKGCLNYSYKYLLKSVFNQKSIYFNKPNILNISYKLDKINYFSFSNMEASVKLDSFEKTIEFLKQNGIDYHIEEHEALPTVKDALEKLKTDKFKPEEYTFLKNLFYKNKAGGFYLLTAHNQSAINMKNLTKLLKAKSDNIRNAEADQLVKYLHVQPGSVNPLALLNLSEEHKKEVEFLFDKAITTEYIAIHPMLNTFTIWVKKELVLNLLKKHSIKITEIDLTQTAEEVPKKEEEKKDGKKPKEGGEKKHVEKEKHKDKDLESQLTVGTDPKKPLAIQNSKFENFSDWYSEVIVKSEMIEYYEISGCYILRPWSYSIWEIIQKFFDEKIKELGVENSYFPLFVSEKALNKEVNHVAGFKPEVAWVTRSGDSELENPIAIRPTSETIMYPSFAKWIRSHRDLPLKLNQWTNVVRWEFKNPTPFIRTREFLWQEGHTAHATKEESDKQVYDILDLYRQVYEYLLAVPVVPGRKSENEKFAGAAYTTTIETMIPANGKAIQCATSHNLGTNFSKMFEISYQNEKKEQVLVHQTSWGMTTRTIGVMTMTHGDDKGLILPPRVAPLQVILIPIINSKDDPKIIHDKLYDISAILKKNKIRSKVDDNEVHNPGFKYNYWELRGVPLRIEFGNKDMMNGQVTLVCRDNGERLTAKYDDVLETVNKFLEIIQLRMYEKAKHEFNSRKTQANDFDTFLKLISDKNTVLTPWCEDKLCEDNVKKQVKIEAEKSGIDGEVAGTAKTLCLPLDQEPLKEDDKCFFCGEKAKIRALWGRSY